MNDHSLASAPGTRRVLFPFVGNSVGGSHISSLLLAAGLDPERYEPIVAVHQEGKLRSYLEDRGISAVRAPHLGTAALSGRTARMVPAMALVMPRLIGLLRRLRIDIVHTNDARMHYYWIPPAKLAGRRSVLHLQNASQSRIGTASRLADALITVSDFCRRSQLSPRSRRAQVVPTPFVPPSPPQDRGLCRARLLAEAKAPPQTTTIVGYVANLAHRKRPLIFIELAARLRGQFGDKLFFPMFGETDGARNKPIKDEVVAKIQEHGLTSTCVLMGPRSPIDPWMSGCDLLVAPSVQEPYGRTLIEAMFCGTPVVAADDGGNKEIIRHGETGLLVRADDPAAFAAAVADLHRHPGRARVVAAAAKAAALRTWSLETHVEQVQSIYDSLL